MNEYTIMFRKFIRKEISEKEWRDFINKIFEKILEENKEILINLKNI